MLEWTMAMKLGSCVHSLALTNSKINNKPSTAAEERAETNGEFNTELQNWDGLRRQHTRKP
jgi:hypothetical protein